MCPVGGLSSSLRGQNAASGKVQGPEKRTARSRTQNPLATPPGPTSRTRGGPRRDPTFTPQLQAKNPSFPFSPHPGARTLEASTRGQGRPKTALPAAGGRPEARVPTARLGLGSLLIPGLHRPPLRRGRVPGPPLPRSYRPGPARRRRGRRGARPARPPGSAPPRAARAGWAAPRASWPWSPFLEARGEGADGLCPPGPRLPPRELLHGAGAPFPGEPAPPPGARSAPGPPKDRQRGASGGRRLAPPLPQFPR